MKKSAQTNLFESGPLLPDGFKYEADLIAADEEQQLLREMEKLPFKQFEFHGYSGKRRVVSFGWRYDFNERELKRADDIPAFLLALRQKAAEFTALEAKDLQHVLVSEYAPGAAIGWHRDKASFDQIVGISLLASCRFRFRRKRGEGWERAELMAEPRSVYLLTGRSRTEWEHSIPPVEQLRYSITFRSLVRIGGVSDRQSYG